jgi:hypothetical protein
VDEDADEMCDGAIGGGGVTFSLPLKPFFAMGTLRLAEVAAAVAVELVAGITRDESP